MKMLTFSIIYFLEKYMYVENFNSEKCTTKVNETSNILKEA